VSGSTMSLPAGCTIGFLGGGVMAEAICRGVLSSKVLPAGSVSVYEIYEPRRAALEAMDLGINIATSQEKMVKESDIVILATKPEAVGRAMAACAESWSKEKLLVSICAGVTLGTLTRSMMPGVKSVRAVRVMPNTPCLVGEAATAFCLSERCQLEDRAKVEAIMANVGMAVEVQETMMDAVTGLSGSGPGYVYMFIEALSDAGVLQGIPRAVARRLAAQAVYGTAKMVIEDPGTHLGELRNRVESPGGTTIAGTQALEAHGFRAAVVAAVAAATRRSADLG
jgi:pyrroline-5-carboxylate reductase